MTRKLIKPKPFSIAANILQRKCSCKENNRGGVCETCGGNKETSKPIDVVPPVVQEVLQSGGSSLDATTRSIMEPHFAHDFSKVRVHTGSRAA